MIRLFVIVVLATTALVSPAWAESWKDKSNHWRQCQNGNPDEKISGCTAVIQSGHESLANVAEALSNRCWAYYLKRENDQAIADCSQAINLHPNFVIAYGRRGAAYMGKGQYDRAIEDYNKAIQRASRVDHYFLANLFIGRGSSYSFNGQHDRAIEDYTQALGFMPNNAAAFWGRATVYKLKGEYDRAIEDYNKAIQIEPANTYALYGRCAAYAIIGHFDQALSDCNHVLSLNDFHDPYALGLRGFTYLKMGLYDLAIADYDVALTNNTKAPIFLYGRGLAKEKKGDATGGAADMAAAIQLDAGVADQFVKWGTATDSLAAAPNAPFAAMPVSPASLNVAASVTAPRSAATVVMDYLTAAALAAAGTDASAARKSFLSSGCKDDMVTEFKAEKESGWSFSGTDTKIVSEKVNAEDGKATVVARVVYKGGTSQTFLSKEHKFFLTVENGAWRISEMDPAPGTVGPGVKPL